MPTCSRQPPETVYYGLITSDAPMPLLIGLTPKGALCRVHFASGKPTGAIVKQWQKEWPTAQFIKKQADVAAWWSKTAKRGSLPALLLVGTPFQCRVWSALLTIPSGETITYGALAKRIGKPAAARAVGTALGKNPVPLLVPCHRIVATNGLGGFTGGLTLKKRLLANEKRP